MCSDPHESSTDGNGARSDSARKRTWPEREWAMKCTTSVTRHSITVTVDGDALMAPRDLVLRVLLLIHGTQNAMRPTPAARAPATVNAEIPL